MLSNIQSIHFIGICGTAMASVAAALQERGVRVTGSDVNVYPPMSTFLAERGIEVQVGYRKENLNDAPELVVIGNAISRGNPEAEAVLERKLRYCSLPELLKETFIRGKRSIVIAGTHGKTTTTALLTWVFEHNGLNPSYLIGGIPNNFSQGACFTNSEWFIIEGDEYDTAFFDKRSKFIHYQPEVAVLNNLEFDHADIFENLAQIQKSFRHFINLIPRNGLLIANGDDANIAPLLKIDHCPIQRFGLGDAAGLRFAVEGSRFSIGGTEFSLPLFGELNVRNALAVIAVARHCGLSDLQIQSAFDSFEGIKRRMEVRGEACGVTVIDDFAHHPTAIRETLKALKARYPSRRIWAIFEPRSNSTRRSVFQDELAASFMDADQVVVAQVARLEQIPEAERLDAERLMADIRSHGAGGTYLSDVDVIVNHVASEAVEGDILCVLSNGGFGGIHEKLLAALRA
ncbi:MAG: UDP-N-acetylmuramate:L-alanyl-gamma-D-glutamyl-meso-diaminopimelate ligase [Verrucomicrobia subdivision 3 bacterium]|nr:UDP-N-acetylmuramate:L-alanyl-gamma-D-glutamyl-meso-diaminopimelate ligase [Limisphaerales bacterium]